MRFYLEPKGWPTSIQNAPYGLCARLRKGRAFLYFKTIENKVYDMSANPTTVTGTVTPVVLRTEGN